MFLQILHPVDSFVRRFLSVTYVGPENLKIKFRMPDEAELFPKIVFREITWSILS